MARCLLDLSGSQRALNLLGAGILVDVVVVRALMVPAMVALFGRGNWLPAQLARVLRVRPSTPGRRIEAPAGAMESAA